MSYKLITEFDVFDKVIHGEQGTKVERYINTDSLINAMNELIIHINDDDKHPRLMRRHATQGIKVFRNYIQSIKDKK